MIGLIVEKCVLKLIRVCRKESKSKQRILKWLEKEKKKIYLLIRVVVIIDYQLSYEI